MAEERSKCSELNDAMKSSKRDQVVKESIHQAELDASLAEVAHLREVLCLDKEKVRVGVLEMLERFIKSPSFEYGISGLYLVWCRIGFEKAISQLRSYNHLVLEREIDFSKDVFHLPFVGKKTPAYRGDEFETTISLLETYAHAKRVEDDEDYALRKRHFEALNDEEYDAVAATLRTPEFSPRNEATEEEVGSKTHVEGSIAVFAEGVLPPEDVEAGEAEAARH